MDAHTGAVTGMLGVEMSVAMGTEMNVAMDREMSVTTGTEMSVATGTGTVPAEYSREVRS